MKNNRRKEEYVVVFMTAPDLKTARTIVSKALEDKLIACANITSKIESHYWWEGKIDKSNEVLVVMKTTTAKAKTLQKTVLENHPYKTPEFISIKIKDGFKGYLDWISDSVNG